MPIPFRDLTDNEPAGVAAYLRFIDEPGGKGIRGALFIMSTRGEPLEFTFTRIDSPASVLWRAGQARSQAVSRLVKALFESTARRPDVVLAPARETPPTVFAGDIAVEASLCRVAAEDSTPMASAETAQRISDAITLYWVNGLPKPGESPANTVELLVRNQMLVEPFDRAGRGIEEAFAS